MWQQIQEILLEPDKYPKVKIELSEQSPLSPEFLNIPMVGRMNTTQFIEIIARNILQQELELHTSTWIAIEHLRNSQNGRKFGVFFWKCCW